jgi:hypothetical protein
VSMRKKQVPALKRRVQCANAVRIRYRPDLVDASEAVGRLYLRRPHYLTQETERAAQVVTPEPQTTRIVAFAKRFAAIAGEPETLAVNEESGLLIAGAVA